MNPSRKILWFVFVVGLTATPARGQGDGLAAKYPKDAGIGLAKAVLLHDDFEDGKIGAKWDEIGRRKGRGATDDADPVQAEKDGETLDPKLVGRFRKYVHHGKISSTEIVPSALPATTTGTAIPAA